MTITVDPEAVNKTAVSVMGEPYGFINRAHGTIATDCHLPFLAFGIAPSLAISGPYEDCRAKLETVGKQGAETFQALATGLANVAKAHGAAEAANTMICVPVNLPPTGIASDGSDSTGTQSAILGVEVMLMAEWIATGGMIAACGALAPTAAVAAITWALVQPDDASLSRALSAWGSVGEDVGHGKEYLDLALKPLDAAWPDEDSSRQQFDRWMIPFGDNVDKYADAAGKAGDALADAVNNVHEVQRDAFLAASITFGVLLALTAMEAIPFAAAAIEPIKEITGVVLGVEIGANVIIVGEVLKNVFDLFKGMIDSVESFDFAKPGSHTMPRFQDVKIDWAHA